MSQSSEAIVTLEDLRKDGYPVKRGVRVFRSDSKTVNPAEAATEQWLHRWAKHACQNFQTVTNNPGIRFLVGAGNAVPAFVVGIGPSLDACLPELKQIEGRAILIATDAAYKPLLANNIKPDMVISYDCKAEQKTLWEGVPTEGIPCLFDSCAHPEAIASWRGPVLFYNHWHQQDEFSNKLLPYIFPNIGQLPSAGTVGNMGLLAAKVMECDPIIAVGMDFCYAPTDAGGWIYRARDYKLIDDGDGCHWKEAENKILYNNDERVARSFEYSVGGKTYRTDPELSIYYRALERIIKEFKINLINLSPLSMMASTQTTMTLAEAIMTYCLRPLSGGRTVIPYIGRIL